MSLLVFTIISFLGVEDLKVKKITNSFWLISTKTCLLIKMVVRYQTMTKPNQLLYDDFDYQLLLQPSVKPLMEVLYWTLLNTHPKIPVRMLVWSCNCVSCSNWIYDTYFRFSDISPYNFSINVFTTISPRTNQYRPILTQYCPILNQYHHVSTSDSLYWHGIEIICPNIQMSDFPLSTWYEHSCTLV